MKILDKGILDLIDTMGTDDQIVEAARKSYKSKKKYKTSIRELIRFLMRSGHMSPFEMAELKFYVRAPIFVFRQWCRHRTYNFNELSGRYTELGLGYYVPYKWRKQSETNKQDSEDGKVNEIYNMCINQHYRGCDNLYKSFLDGDVAREQSRIVLPLAMYSDMYCKCDLRNIFNFLKQRLDKHAQWEIRQYAKAMAKMVKEKFPLSYEAFEDYILNAVTFSSIEIKLIDSYMSIDDGYNVSGCPDIKSFKKKCKSKGMTKREIDEFLIKLEQM